MTGDGVTLLSELEQEISRRYHDRGIAVFVPRDFLTLAGEDVLVGALAQLAKSGLLTGRAKLLCSVDPRHVVWAGDLRDLERNRHRICPYCEEPEEPEDVAVHFELTATAKRGLDEKKTPQFAPR